MPIHTGWSIWFAPSTSSNANLFWNCSRHTEIMLFLDNQVSWHPWPGQVDTELTNTEAVYKGVSRVKRKPRRIMQDPGMFLSPLGLRGTIAWIQEEELKLEEKASQWEPWPSVQGPGQTAETKNMSRGMDTPASFSLLPLSPGSASHGRANQAQGRCPWGASGHSAGWRRVEDQRSQWKPSKN